MTHPIVPIIPKNGARTQKPGRISELVCFIPECHTELCRGVSTIINEAGDFSTALLKNHLIGEAEISPLRSAAVEMTRNFVMSTGGGFAPQWRHLCLSHKQVFAHEPVGDRADKVSQDDKQLLKSC